MNINIIMGSGKIHAGTAEFVLTEMLSAPGIFAMLCVRQLYKQS